MNDYVPEIGQFCDGNPSGEFSLSEIGEAAFFAAYREFERVFWNIHQRKWADHWPDATIDGVTARKYYWGDDESVAVLPNFEACGLEIRWYKHPGRGMSVSRELSPDEWSDWLRAVLGKLHGANQADWERDIQGEGDDYE